MGDLEAARYVTIIDGPSSRALVATLAVALVTGMGGFAAAGLDLVPPEADHGADGKWLEPFDGEVPAIHLSLRPDGSVAYYGGDHPHETEEPFNWSYFTAKLKKSRSRVMDLDQRNPVAPADEPGPDLFCSAPITTPQGQTLTAGGSEWIPSNQSMDGPVLGHDDSYELGMDADQGDGSRPAWETNPDMNNRRWYPTALTLSDGTLAVFSGIRNLTNPATNVVSIDELAPGAEQWRNVQPDLELAPGVTVEHQGRSGDAEKAPVNLPMYPRLFVVSGGPHEGDVVYLSNGDLWGEFGERPAEEPLWGTIQTYDTGSETWTVHSSSVFGARHLGSTVPLVLDPADDYVPTLLTFGGTLQRSAVATNTAETVTLDEENPTPEPTDPMERKRWQPQGQLLPTGEVVAVGGNELDTTIFHGQKVPHVMTAEIYDPDTGQWSTAATMDVKRGYHSTSVVTPDGTVLAAGHVPNPNPFPQFRNNNFAALTPTHEDDHTILNQTHHGETRFEEFVPPYLEQPNEDRPEIVGAQVDGVSFTPGEHPGDIGVEHQDTFEVTVEGLDEGLQDVVLLRSGAATHGLHADQRGVRLNVLDQTGANSQGPATLTLEAPPDGAVAPPGHYMLFVNEDAGEDGYPSRAAWVGLSVPDATAQ
jgi:hypothetical protein